MSMHLYRQRKCHEEDCFHGIIRTFKPQRNIQGIVSGCGSGPMCIHCEMFKVNKTLVRNTPVSAKSEYYNKKSKHPREIK